MNTREALRWALYSSCFHLLVNATCDSLGDSCSRDAADAEESSDGISLIQTHLHLSSGLWTAHAGIASDATKNEVVDIKRLEKNVLDRIPSTIGENMTVLSHNITTVKNSLEMHSKYDKHITNQKHGNGTAIESFLITDKPKADSRTYQGATLANGLRVLNIQDEASVQSAMAMGVMSGSYNDPDEIPGLAHFCEHMLFLGSKNYPDPSEWDQFLSKNGGGANAYTDVELTDYFFQVSSSAFTEAMPRFADWFSAPLFNPEYVEKEVNAVNSEHEKNIQDQGWRIYDTLRHLASPDSPVSHFHTGNTETLLTEPAKLGINLTDAVRKYFDEHYCAAKMRLVTYGPDSVSAQLAGVEAAFGSINAGSASCQAPQSFAQPKAWPSDRLQKWVNIQGVTAEALFFVMFPMPDTTADYASRPDAYFKYVFGYTGGDSFIRVLDIEYGLISQGGLTFESDSASGMMKIVFKLTDLGKANQGVIVDILFLYIAILRQDGINKELYESLAEVSKLQWDWAGMSAPAATVEMLAAILADAPLNHSLWAYRRTDVVNQTLVNSMLELMTPKNMIVAYVAPEGTESLFKGVNVLTLPYYGVQYSVEPLNTTSIQKWQDWIEGTTSLSAVSSSINATLIAAGAGGEELKYTLPKAPGPIAGIPTNLSLEKMEATMPVNGTPTESLFGFPPQTPAYLPSDLPPMDFKYRQGWVTTSPKVRLGAVVRALKESSDLETSPEQLIEHAVWNALIAEYLEPKMADFVATGVTYSISTSSNGLSLAFSGWAPTLPQLVTKAINNYIDFAGGPGDCQPKMWMVNSYNKFLENYRVQFSSYSMMPIDYAIMDRNMLVLTSEYSSEELLKAVDSLSLGSVQAAGCSILADKSTAIANPMVLTALSMGNLDELEAADTVRMIAGIPGVSDAVNMGLNASGEIQHNLPVVKPAKPVELRKLNPRSGDPNDAVVVSVLIGVSDIQSRVLFGIIGKLLGTVAFDELRTNRQLGYVVNGGMLQLSNVLGISVVVQGTELGADEVEAAINGLYHKIIPETLASLTDTDFESYVSSYKDSLLTPPTSIDQEFSHFWDTVLSSEPSCYKLQDEMLRYIDFSLTSKQLLVDAWHELMDPSSGMRTKLVVKYFANEVPPRPTLAEARAMWDSESVPESSIKLLEREYDAAVLLTKADSAARNQLREAGGLYASDVNCELQSSAFGIVLGRLCLLVLLVCFFLS